jgi:hypothetical protein
MNVCYPLLQTTHSELEKFHGNPEEFVAIASDTCDKQVKPFLYFCEINYLKTSQIVKTQAAQFLENICDNIDGALSFVAMTTLAIMEFSIVYNDLHNLEEKYPALIEFKDNLFMAKTDRVIRIDTCLVYLSSLSYVICKRKDLV